MKAGTQAEDCSLTVAGTGISCEMYFYLATADGLVKVFILAAPHSFAFIGASDRPATEAHHVVAVTTVRREEGKGAKEYPATGKCVVDISGTGNHQTIAVECGVDSDIGRAEAKFRDPDTAILVSGGS